VVAPEGLTFPIPGLPINLYLKPLWITASQTISIGLIVKLFYPLQFHLSPVPKFCMHFLFPSFKLNVHSTICCLTIPTILSHHQHECGWEDKKVTKKFVLKSLYYKVTSKTKTDGIIILKWILGK